MPLSDALSRLPGPTRRLTGLRRSHATRRHPQLPHKFCTGVLFDNSADIPPSLSDPARLTRGFLQAYLRQSGDAVVAWGQLEGVLGVFQKLLSSSANEAYAFQLLGTVVMNVSASATTRPCAPLFSTASTKRASAGALLSVVAAENGAGATVLVGRLPTVLASSGRRSHRDRRH